MAMDLNLFRQQANVTDTMVIYRKAGAQGHGNDQFELREPVDPPLHLRIKAWFSPNSTLGRLIGSQDARSMLRDMYQGIDMSFAPLHVTAGLYGVLKGKHGAPLARLVTTVGAKQGTGASKAEKMLSFYRRNWAQGTQSTDPAQGPRCDDPDSWQF